MMSLKKCSICGKEFEGEQDVCETCATQAATPEVNKAQEEAKVEREVPKEKPNNKKKKMIIGGIIAVVVVAIAGIGIKINMDKKAHEAYVSEYNTYVTDLKTARYNIIKGASSAETMSNELKAVWYNAIWKTSDPVTDPYTKSDGVFVSDFNKALNAYLTSEAAAKKEVELEGNKMLVEANMEDLKEVPEGLEDHYAKLSDLYEVYLDYANLAINPSGSYTTYRDKITSLSSDLLTKYDRMDALNYDEIS